MFVCSKAHTDLQSYLLDAILLRTFAEGFKDSLKNFNEMHLIIGLRLIAIDRCNVKFYIEKKHFLILYT